MDSLVANIADIWAQGGRTWFTLAVVGLMFALLAFSHLATDIILLAGLGLFLLSGIVTTSQALAGLSNEGMVSVGILYVVGIGVRETGGITWLAERLFGRPTSAINAILRLMIPTATLSAFMNNTPLVAMLIPAVGDWAKKFRIPASKLMIPLSYSAILGGTCALIGTSTNLVVSGMYTSRVAHDQQAGEHLQLDRSMGMFDIAWVGIPAALVGIAFIAGTSRWLLPARRPAISHTDDPRQYTAEMVVAPESPLVGKSIEEAGLRHLPGAFLAEIDRDGQILPAVGPKEHLRANDRLVFVGIVESVVDLQKIRGLLPATEHLFQLSSPRSERCLIEAVVSNTCPLVGRTIRDGRFRSTYNAAVIAVARNGERLQQKIGDIVLQPGDTLLLESHPSFSDQQRNSRDFFLVSRLENSHPPRHELAFVSLLILLAMVVVVTLEWTSMLVAGTAAAALILLTRCASVEVARKSIDWEVLLAIAASFGIGTALEASGAAALIAQSFLTLAQGNPWATLAVVYAVTLIVTELITNNAAAALMFPLAWQTAANLPLVDGQHANPMSFVIVVMMAASAGFATPIGYQTNLMVYGPGGYKFRDYLRIGVPLDLLIGVVTVSIAPWVWPFYPA